MKCVHCGANIPDDQMICPVCGAEVQIVPDYNPLDDVLAREVRGSVEGATRQIRTDDIRRYRREDLTKNINSTRVLSEDEMERIRSNRRKSTNNTERNSAELRRQRQARQQKRLEAAKRKRRRLLLTLAAVVILIGFGIYVAYQNSYTGMLKKGYRAVNEKEYMAAEKYFDRAIIKDKSRPDAYVGLAEIYLDQNDTDGAEDVYLSAIETQPTNEKLYQPTARNVYQESCRFRSTFCCTLFITQEFCRAGPERWCSTGRASQLRARCSDELQIGTSSGFSDPNESHLSEAPWPWR